MKECPCRGWGSFQGQREDIIPNIGMAPKGLPAGWAGQESQAITGAGGGARQECSSIVHGGNGRFDLGGCF